MCNELNYHDTHPCTHFLPPLQKIAVLASSESDPVYSTCGDPEYLSPLSSPGSGGYDRIQLRDGTALNYGVNSDNVIDRSPYYSVCSVASGSVPIQTTSAADTAHRRETVFKRGSTWSSDYEQPTVTYSSQDKNETDRDYNRRDTVFKHEPSSGLENNPLGSAWSGEYEQPTYESQERNENDRETTNRHNENKPLGSTWSSKYEQPTVYHLHGYKHENDRDNNRRGVDTVFIREPQGVLGVENKPVGSAWSSEYEQPAPIGSIKLQDLYKTRNDCDSDLRDTIGTKPGPPPGSSAWPGDYYEQPTHSLQEESGSDGGNGSSSRARHNASYGFDIESDSNRTHMYKSMAKSHDGSTTSWSGEYEQAVPTTTSWSSDYDQPAHALACATPAATASTTWSSEYEHVRPRLTLTHQASPRPGSHHVTLSGSHQQQSENKTNHVKFESLSESDALA